ncbi:MAG TPA: AAA family ATPase [Candidatus Saccharimonadales bacterium]
MKPYIVTYAGVPGSSKSIVAHHLSVAFSLPIFSTDNIRFEVKEDLRAADITLPEPLREYERRYDERWEALLASGKSCIFDASMDRRWETVKQQLVEAGYDWYLIDMELSRDFLLELYGSTKRQKAIEELDAYLRQHKMFIERYAADVSLQIDDQGFAKRLQLAENGLRTFLEAK